jgi:hypothetical protein
MLFVWHSPGLTGSYIPHPLKLAARLLLALNVTSALFPPQSRDHYCFTDTAAAGTTLRLVSAADTSVSQSNFLLRGHDIISSTSVPPNSVSSGIPCICRNISRTAISIPASWLSVSAFPCAPDPHAIPSNFARLSPQHINDLACTEKKTPGVSDAKVGVPFQQCAHLP